MRDDAEDTWDEIEKAWAKARPEFDLRPIQVYGRILRCAKLIFVFSDWKLAEYGLVRADFEMLTVLRRFDRGMTPTELSRHLLLTAPATTKRLYKLEALELIERAVNPADRRGFLIELTPPGIDLIDELFEEQLSDGADLLAGMSAKDQRQLADLLKSLLIDWEKRVPADPLAILVSEPG